MVSAIVPAAFQSASLRFVEWPADIFCFGYNWSATVEGVARTMEPGFRVAAALDAVELEHGVANHCVHVVADNECAGKFLAHLDAQTLVGRDPLRDVSDADGARGTGEINLVAIFDVFCDARSGDDGPIGCCCGVCRYEFSLYCRAERLAVFIDDLKFGSLADMVELALGIGGQVARLVHADRRNVGVQGVEVGLVQGVGNKGVCLVRCRCCVFGEYVVQFRHGRIVCANDRVVPTEWINRPNQVVGGVGCECRNSHAHGCSSENCIFEHAFHRLTLLHIKRIKWFVCNINVL